MADENHPQQDPPPNADDLNENVVVDDNVIMEVVGNAEPNEEIELEFPQTTNLSIQQHEYSNHNKNNYNGWDNLRWMSYAGVRKESYRETNIYRNISWNKDTTSSANSSVLPGGFSFWSQQTNKNTDGSSSNTTWLQRTLVIYEEPSLILVLKENEETDSETYTSPYIVESVIDPVVSKLQLSSLTTPSSLGEDPMQSFEIITPNERIQLRLKGTTGGGADAEPRSNLDLAQSTSRCEKALSTALCRAQLENETDGIGKHQIVLGTLHSHVLSGNIKQLQQALTKAQQTCLDVDEFRALVEGKDDCNYTPLYYACTKASYEMVQCLVNAGANTTSFRQEETGDTYLHMACRELNVSLLKVLLADTGQTNPNVLNFQVRTPFAVAVMESVEKGSNFTGKLEECLSTLESAGGKLATESITREQHYVSILASDWKAQRLHILLEHLPFRFPLESASGQRNGTSLGALYDYPIHVALLSLTDIVSTGLDSHDRMARGSLSNTLKVLFGHGFEPNERIEIPELSPLFEKLSGFNGFSPLQILGIASIKLSQLKGRLDMELFDELRILLGDIGQILLQHGARINLSIPPHERPRRPISSASFADSEKIEDESHGESTIPRNMLKLDTSEIFMSVIGKDSATTSMDQYSDLRPVVASNWTKVSDIHDKSRIPDSPKPGGSSEVSCSICWKPFGTLTNRKHRCRIMVTHVCDECSSKRIIWDGKEIRVSDGQYLLALADLKRQTTHDGREMQNAQRASVSQQGSRSLADVRLERLEAEERAQRESLFGGLLDQAASYVLGDATKTPTDDTGKQVDGMVSQLNETRNALLQRGQKLADLNEKSEQMVESSANFAKMARELRKKSEQSWFNF